MTAYRTLDVNGVTATAESPSRRVSDAVRAFLLAFPTRSLLP